MQCYPPSACQKTKGTNGIEQIRAPKRPICRWGVRPTQTDRHVNSCEMISPSSSLQCKSATTSLWFNSLRGLKSSILMLSFLDLNFHSREKALLETTDRTRCRGRKIDVILNTRAAPQSVGSGHRLRSDSLRSVRGDNTGPFLPWGLTHHRAADCAQRPTRFNFRELQPAVAWTSPKMSGFFEHGDRKLKFCRTNPCSLNFSDSGSEGAGLAEKGSSLLRAHHDWAVNSIAWPHHLRIPFFLISLFLSPSAWQGKRWHTGHAAFVSTLEGNCQTCSC